MKLSCYNKNLKIGTPYLAGWRLEHVLLCCPGPSLADIPGAAQLRRPGLTIAAINTAYPKVSPDIWIGMDVPECYNSKLVNESFIKIFRDCYSAADVAGKPLYDHFNTYFATVEEHPEGFMGMLDMDFPFVPWYRNTLSAALYLLIWMGAKNIYLAGCDLGGERDYWDDRVLSELEHSANRKLYRQQAEFLNKLNPLVKSLGVNLISATEDSPINEFLPGVDLMDFLASFSGPELEIKDHVMKVRASKLDQVTAPLFWKDLSAQHSFEWSEGVMVMADKDQEWLLPWWYDNYSKYNSLPLCFVDIGLSKEMAAWCKEKGIVVKLPPVPLKNWFKKPYALMQTPFLHTLFVDLDCEIRGDIHEAMEYAYPIGLVVDHPNRFSIGKLPVNTGVIAYEYGCELITKWAQDTNYNAQFHRSDQEILQVIIENNPVHWVQMPEKFNWVRLKGKNGSALIYHHTGMEGKENIKKQMIHDVVAN